MSTATGFAKLAELVSRKQSEAADEIQKATAGKAIPKHRILDLYVASGGLERAFMAFLGALEDYVDQRTVLGNGVNGIAGYELISSTDFFGQAIDAFICVVDGLDPKSDTWPSPDSAGGVQTDTGIVRRLRDAVHFEASDLESYRDMLADAARYHESLREAVVRVRKYIRRDFDFSDLFA